ncbi:substrate-binding periplasmic protein [Vibrio neptunius]|uniref:substrate-binding periplasmic protein n=1 Tax=Vibrio neptunius TaxID=170651 RepID=UPI0019D2DE4A|nr:transporter substrate-binding domain-containing protein [Vibrio neptunius]MBN3574681.1 transporter substrate-binding domain-containing protein [Vibrio neptunius]
MKVLHTISVIISISIACTFSAFAKVVTLSNGEYSPYLSKSLKHGGFVTHIVKEAFEAEGYKVEFKYMPWKRGFEQAKSGSVDGSLIWVKNTDREQFFYFTDPVITLSTAVFQKKGANITWDKLSDFKQYKIGGVIGYAYGVEGLEKQGVVKLQRISNPDNNYKKLEEERLDVVLEDSYVGLETINRLGLADELEMNTKTVQDREHFVIISKNSPRAKELIDAFNKGLAKLRSEGKLEAYRAASLKGEYQL